MHKLLSIFVFVVSLFHSMQLCAQENKDSENIMQVDGAYADSDEDVNIFIETPELSQTRDPTLVSDVNIEMPACDNLQLHQLVRDKVADSFDDTQAKSLVEKRRQILMLRHLNKFTEIRLSEITPSSNSMLADKIITYKINKGLKEENMRICRNFSYRPIYLYIYPDQEGFKVEILNFPGQANSENFSVLYN